MRRELQRRLIAEELQRRAAANHPTLPDFIRQYNSGYSDPYWLRPVVDLYDRIADGEEVRAIVQAPPRHGKTDLTLNALAWLLQQDPRRMHAFVTYADRLARSKSRKARRIARSAGVPISRESASVNQWLTTSEGGLLATGVGGPLTGEGITGVGVVDDPIKNRQDAESRLIRDRVWDWWADVFATRLQPGSSVIVQATRWHEDDLTGRLLNDGDWELVNLPAIAEDDTDSLGRAPGTALWPEQYPVERLRPIEEKRPYTWASLYQQRPRPRSDHLFGAPQFYDPDDLAARARSGVRYVAGIDTAYSAKARSDASAAIEGIIWADPMLDGQPRLYVTRVIHARVRLPEFARMLQTLRADYVRWRLYGAEHGIGDTLEEQAGIYLVRDTQVLDKYAYAQPAAAGWNAGMLLLPRRPTERISDLDPGLQTLIQEAQAFTGDDDPNDDTVDACASLWREMLDHVPHDSVAQALTGH